MATDVHRFAKRSVTALRWLAPAALWLAVPKCPVCLAAYVALFTGASLSLTAATALRWALLAGCVALLAWMLARTVWRKRERACCGAGAGVRILNR